MPGPHIDKKFFREASYTRWGPLLAAGARFYEFQPTMFHTKLMVIDGQWTSVGQRELRQPFLPAQRRGEPQRPRRRRFGAEQIAVFERDKARAKEITFADWRARPTNRNALAVQIFPLARRSA